MDYHKKEKIAHIYELYGTQLLRGAVLVVKDVSLAEDVVQETFLSLYLNYEKFREESKISTYLYRIMINKCREKLRKKWFTNRTDVNNFESFINKDSFNDQEDKIVNSITLTEKICKLNRKHREVIVLYYYNGMDVKNIGEILNISESNVKIRLKRGREKLKEFLEVDEKNDSKQREFQENY